MKLVADESVDFGIINKLRLAGIEVISISEEVSGIADRIVLEIAVDHNCLLLTEDKDFGELTHRLKLLHSGILLIRLSDIERAERLEFVPKIIHKYFVQLQGKFSVLTSKGLRIKNSSLKQE